MLPLDSLPPFITSLPACVFYVTVSRIVMDTRKSQQMYKKQLRYIMLQIGLASRLWL